MRLLPNRLTYPLLACALAAPLTISAQEAAPEAAPNAELSQALGFGGRLAADTDAVLGLRNLKQFTKEIAASKTWKQISALLKEADADLSMAEGPLDEVLKFIGKDAFIVFADGSAEQVENLMDVYDGYYRIYYKFAGEAMLASMDLGDVPGGGDLGEVIKKALKNDDGKLLAAFEELQIAPLIAGCRPPKGRAEEAVASLKALEAELPPIVLTSEFDVPGAGKFRSWSLAAKDVFENHYRKKMREELGDDKLADRIEKIIDSKRITLSFGAVGDYLLVGVGEDHKHLKLAANAGESLLSNPDFEFAKGYADKKLLAYSYATKEMLSALHRPRQWEVIADAVADVLEGMVDGGIDVAKAVPLVRKLGGQFAKMTDRAVDSTVGFIYRENGLKGASIGGYSIPGIDADAELQLAGAAPDDAFLVLNGAEDPAAQQGGMAMIETMAGAAYHVANGVAKAEGNEDFAQGFGMFDEIFRPKLLTVWGIMKEKVAKGLGNEGGMVIDLKGSMPKIPGMPGVIIKEGKLPRIAMFNSVKDRKLLTQAWEELVPALNDIAKAIPGQEPGREFQIPDPLTSDGKNITTHFMGLPFASNDFLPSLSISDKLFFLSTSKNFSEELAAKIEKGGDKKATGLLLRVRLSALHSYAEGWLDLVSKNSKEIFADNEYAEEEFKESEPNIRAALELLRGLNGFGFHRYKDGRWRTDWHLDVTDIE